MSSSPWEAAAADDRRLWENLRQGDSRALEQLFQTHYTALFDYGLKLAGQSELVKDAIQDLFIYLWEKRTTLANAASVRAYLLISFRRRLLSAIDRQREQRQALHEIAQERPDNAFSAEDSLIFAEVKESQKQALKKAFETIPARMREALYLKTYTCLSYAEIAQVMDVRPQVARNYVSEAFRRLRDLLAEDQFNR
ncbi:sigma-70 family RNA polymerase sigma factor [Candidatus Parcubacteria bacterium]|nr:MAG: sigma-70 family RNA polymerase sigma factor [Candidatus Parcubacteria bacterium]